MSPTATILLAFVAGGVCGALFPQFAGVIGPVGTVWVKAISAVVVPLVIALLITSIASLADASEVLASRTVVDLVVGSGLDFEDRGEHELNGVPGPWRLFALAR